MGEKERGILSKHSICMTYPIFCVYFYSYSWHGFLNKYYLYKKKLNVAWGPILITQILLNFIYSEYIPY